MMSPFRPWKPGEDASLKNLIAYFYHRFVDLVAASRPNMDKTKLVQEYGAQIYDPVKAQEYGYIDVANSSRNEALLALLHEAKIDPAASYQVVDLEPKSAWLSLFSSQSPSSRERSNIPSIQDPSCPAFKANSLPLSTLGTWIKSISWMR